MKALLGKSDAKLLASVTRALRHVATPAFEAAHSQWEHRANPEVRHIVARISAAGIAGAGITAAADTSAASAATNGDAP